ncbi:uncharacterized protein LOC128783187 isoform X3 [Vidua chalybeata]|uniref:uncharacterized protein LOC128783187 isoform X3 n=1 Tax=Vidua chalybeata TaxID=81927 RepID=UPI0023A8E778|nr:uncharacterized protein LOC128783187 isoform X3 [Vidua chalybeata]
MALALRLFLPLLLAVALPARAAQAAPLQARGAAWDGDMAYPDAQLDDSLVNSVGEILLENAGGPSPWKNSDTGDKKSLEAARHLDQMLSDLERRRGGCISLSLPLGLSSRGLSLHIWTRCARHRGKGSMAAWLPRCCFPALQGCFPAWPGCSFSPASAGRHLASAGREPKLHHGPAIPCNFPLPGTSGAAAFWRREGPVAAPRAVAFS